MNFFVDNSVSPQVSRGLSSNGYSSVHALDYRMAAAPDHEVLARALSEDRTVITADTDFGTLLAQSGAALPSVILLRGPGNRRPGRQLLVLLASLPSLERALAAGSVVVIEGDRIRTRSLPITPAR